MKRKPNIQCDKCEKPFYKKPSDIASTKSGKHYCSHKCRASAAFTDKPKFTTLNCDKCGKAVEKLTCKLKHQSTGKVFCSKSCKDATYFSNGQKGKSLIADLPLSYFVNDAGSNSFVKVRANARTITSNREQKCVVCGYDTHVEACHIKGVASFSLDTKLSVVNHPDNLVLLCRNHHWEFDHGFIQEWMLRGSNPSLESPIRGNRV